MWKLKFNLRPSRNVFHVPTQFFFFSIKNQVKTWQWIPLRLLLFLTSPRRKNKQLKKSHSIFFIALLVATNNSNYPKAEKNLPRPSHSTFHSEGFYFRKNKFKRRPWAGKAEPIAKKSIQMSIKLAQENNRKVAAQAAGKEVIERVNKLNGLINNPRPSHSILAPLIVIGSW